MKQTIIPVLLCLLLSGCYRPASPEETAAHTTEAVVQIANPWKSYGSLEEAEAASGLDFPLPETVADTYTAETFRVMNGELLEVRYCHDNFPVTVRMQAGEGQDLSGVYSAFENVQTFETDGATITDMTVDGGLLQLVYCDGYSYSLYAPNRYWGDSNIEFLEHLYKAS